VLSSGAHDAADARLAHRRQHGRTRRANTRSTTPDEQAHNRSPCPLPSAQLPVLPIASARPPPPVIHELFQSPPLKARRRHDPVLPERPWQVGVPEAPIARSCSTVAFADAGRHVVSLVDISVNALSVEGRKWNVGPFNITLLISLCQG
jgi:hypothetical protein